MAESVEGTYQNLHWFVKLIHGLQERDLDQIIPVSGMKGSGKTTLCLQIAKTYMEEYFPEISFQANLQDFICYDGPQLMQNLLHGEEYYPVVADEAVRWGMAEDWARWESKELKKMLAQIRLKHRLILVAIPSFFWLDRKIREDMTQFWLQVVGRGHALVFQADQRIGVADVWHQKDFENIKGSFSIFTPPLTWIRSYKRHLNFFDVVSFPKMEEDIYQKYLRLREKKILGPDSFEAQPFEAAVYNFYKRGFEHKGVMVMPTLESLALTITDPMTGRPLFSSEFYRRLINKIENKIQQQHRNSI